MLTTRNYDISEEHINAALGTLSLVSSLMACLALIQCMCSNLLLFYRLFFVHFAFIQIGDRTVGRQESGERERGDDMQQRTLGPNPRRPHEGLSLRCTRVTR